MEIYVGVISERLLPINTFRRYSCLVSRTGWLEIYGVPPQLQAKNQHPIIYFLNMFVGCLTSRNYFPSC